MAAVKTGLESRKEFEDAVPVPGIEMRELTFYRQICPRFSAKCLVEVKIQTINSTFIIHHSIKK